METIPVGKGIPVQEKTRGGLTVTRTTAWTAPGCHNGCGVKLFTDENGMLVKVEGDPDAPFNQGRLCPRCCALPGTVFSERRMLHPMKRAREDRGKDKWQQISWDEAYDIIIEKMTEIKDTYGAETFIFNQGTGRDIVSYLTRFMWSYGSPNYVGFQSGNSCYVPRIVGMTGTMGAFWLGDFSQQFPDRFDNPEWQVPGVVFNWGVNNLVSNADGNMGWWILECMKRGSKLVVIDPKVTWLAARADLHLRIRPGSDGALAMGIVNYLIENDLYDHKFVEQWCYGFEELAERAKEYPLDKVAELCWITEDEIVQAAHYVVDYGTSTMQWGLPADANNQEATPAAQAINAIWQITGLVDVPGGMMIPVDIMPGGYAGGWGRELLSPEQAAKKIGADVYPLMQFSPWCSPDKMIETLETGEPYKIRGAWFETNNVLACMGTDAERLLSALKDLEFIVYVDPYMTPTAMALADIFLPVCMFPERNGIALTTGSQRAAAMIKVCEPQGESKSDQQILLELGRRINPDAWPWDTVEEMFSAQMEATGLGFDEVRVTSPVYPKFTYRKYEKGLLRPDGQPGFATATGRIELWSTMLNGVGLDPLPFFSEPVPSPFANPDYYEEYPLVVSTGIRRHGFFHAEHRENPYLRRLTPEPICEMNPKDAEKYGVAEGDWIWVENRIGRCQSRVHLNPTILEGTATTDHAWWFPEGDPEKLYSVRDVNTNNLTEFRPGKNGYGMNLKALLCKVYKADGPKEEK